MAVALLCLGLASSAAAQEADPARFVDPFIGTSPPGFVFPGAVVPFGMVQNSPDTMGEFAYGGYLYTDPTIRGFSLVHLSGPGVKKAGDLPFMPTLEPPTQDPNVYASTFSHASEQATPGYYRVRLDEAQTDVELTASTHAAMQRYTFTPGADANVIVDVSRRVPGVAEGSFRVTGPDEITGMVKSKYPVHFVARFSRPFKDSGTFAAQGRGAGGWVSFDTASSQTVTMRAGISFVDAEGARRNLEAEAPGFDFDGMRARARAAWNSELSRVEVDGGGSELDKRTFYTALYHAQLHPNVFTDVDGRYLGFDGQAHRAEGRTQYANFSSWDLYKSQNQLLALIQPERYRDMLLSLLADFREGGKLPRWGEQNVDSAHMSGDPAVPAITEGVCRGLLDRDDAEALYRASVDLQAARKPELDRLGYLPGNAGTTLEYGVADFSLALMADALGYGEEARRWREQSLRYRNLLDPETKFIRPRDADGKWLEPFDPAASEGFQEGNSWQYSWLGPHDARGIFDRMGGDGVAAQRLDHIFRYPAEALSRLNVFGLVYETDTYAPANEHDLQVPWMYPFAGRPWRSMDELRDLQSLFRATPEGMAGNDDLGGLSSWHVWSALGFGPVTPGAPFYVLGSPQFERAVVRVPGRPEFSVSAPGTSLTARYVRGPRLRGQALQRAWFFDDLPRGGELRLPMSGDPDTDFGVARSARPPSASDSALSEFGCRAGFATGVPRAIARPRLRVSVAPRRVRAGQRKRFRFRVTTRREGRARPVRGAFVRFAGRRVRTNRRGRASQVRQPRSVRRYRVLAVRRGYVRHAVRIRVMPSQRR